jgi:hypothetical protein
MTFVVVPSFKKVPSELGKIGKIGRSEIFIQKLFVDSYWNF